MSTKPIMDIDDVVAAQLRKIDEIEARIKRLKESHGELLEVCKFAAERLAFGPSDDLTQALRDAIINAEALCG